MRKTLIKIEALTLFLLLFVTVSEGQERGALLQKDSILVGDQVVLSVTFDLQDSLPVMISPYSQTLSQDTAINGGVEVVNDFLIDTLSYKDGVRELRAKTLLTSFDSGRFVLPTPVIITIRSDGSPDTLSFERSTLYVDYIQLDTASFKPYDIKGQEKYPITFKEVYPWILIAVIILLIVLGVIRYIEMRRQNKNFFGKSIVKEPPHIVALRRLEKIRKEKLWQKGEAKEFYSGITDTLKEYMEARYNFGAVEMTSSEIMEQLGTREIESTLYDSLGEMLQRADLVKFAKYTPEPSENEEAVPVAVKFVNFAYVQQLSEQDMRESNEQGTESDIKEDSNASVPGDEKNKTEEDE